MTGAIQQSPAYSNLPIDQDLFKFNFIPSACDSQRVLEANTTSAMRVAHLYTSPSLPSPASHLVLRSRGIGEAQCAFTLRAWGSGLQWAEVLGLLTPKSRNVFAPG